VLLIAAALFVTAGVLNFTKRWHDQPPPTDGVQWVQNGDRIIAESVKRDSTGARAGILPGDRLIAISEFEGQDDQIANASDVQIYLEEARVGGHLTYLIERPSYPEETRYYYADLYNLDAHPRWQAHDLYLNLIGLVWLFVGLFVLFKQGARAPYVTHFATVCLAAFVFHFFKPTVAYEDLDSAIAFLDDAGFILFAPLFLHFCATYPVRYHLSTKRRWLAALLYIPAVLLIGTAALLYFPKISRPARFIAPAAIA
jgi:hypothetical protein